ncbi:MAG: DUF3794 domain-containing protein [Clostridia bacterium]|nr:DUF3794 domain-containing protein [Clostridia bacterium]
MQFQLHGNICIYKKEILEGKIRLDGNVNIYLMYLADGENGRTRAFNANIDFTEILDFPKVESGMILDENIWIKNIECKVLNGRKVNFKVLLELESKVFLNENEEMIREIKGIDDIESQIVSLKMNSLVGQNSSKALAKETIVIDSTDNLEEILSVDFNIKNKDTKISYNKVLAKADIELSVLYLTDDGRIKKAEENIPVMGFIDIVGVSDDDICDMKYKLKNISVKPNATEEHSIGVDVELEIYCRVFGNKEVSVIQDMYSPSRNLEFKSNSVSTAVNMQNTKTSVNIREKVRLENQENSKICSGIAYAVINERNVGRDVVKYEGDLKLKFILLNNEETETRKEEISIPFSFSQEIQGINKDSRVEVEITPIFQEFTKDGAEITAKIDLEAQTNSYNLETINVIDGIEEREEGDECPYSMVIYFVKPGDTIWKIAKKYKSTVSDIARVNNIENPDKISVGMQLFIPKSMKIRNEIPLKV